MSETPNKGSVSAQTFATRLARFAYSPTSAGPSTSPSPLKAIKLERGDLTVEAGPSTPSPVRASRATSTPRKRNKTGSDEEYADEDEYEEGGRKQKKKTPKKPRGFAAPEVYGHLKPVTDILRDGLDSECLRSPRVTASRTSQY